MAMQGTLRVSNVQDVTNCITDSLMANQWRDTSGPRRCTGKMRVVVVIGLCHKETGSFFLEHQSSLAAITTT